MSKKISRVFPSDKLLQTLDKYPCGFVANRTDPSNKPGTHWVTFYFSSDWKGEFFTVIDDRQIIRRICFKTFQRNMLANGITINANYKAYGPMFVDSIAYFTLVTEHV